MVCAVMSISPDIFGSEVFVEESSDIGSNPSACNCSLHATLIREAIKTIVSLAKLLRPDA